MVIKKFKSFKRYKNTKKIPQRSTTPQKGDVLYDGRLINLSVFVRKYERIKEY